MKQTKSSIFVYLAIFICLALLSAFSVQAAQSAVNLGTAGDFAILSKTGISTTGVTAITGDIGVSPIDHTAITGFALIGVPASDAFLTSAIVTGNIYSADLVPPTPANIGTSVSNMETAYTDAQGRTTDSSPQDTTELGAGDISGMTIVPGLHKWSTGVLINTDVTLDCSSNPNGVFIFQIAQDLTIASGARVNLIDCKTQNIFWSVAGGVGVEIGTTAQFKGIILSAKAIHLRTGATLDGRALAQTAVTLDANTVTAPTGSAASTPTPVSTHKNNTDSGTGSGNSGSSEVQCAAWSSCDSNGKSTRVCTLPDNQGTSIGSRSCASATANMTRNNTARNDSDSTNRQKNETFQENTAKNSTERTDSNRTESGETKEDIIARINLRTGLNISLTGNTSLGATLRAYLSNGKYAYINVLPADASAKAQAELKAKCYSTNCTVELKEINVNGEAASAYEVKTEKSAKLFGFINIKEHVQADINAQDGSVVAVQRPWWSFAAKETDN